MYGNYHQKIVLQFEAVPGKISPTDGIDAHKA
jgi:hypothetical protein